MGLNNNVENLFVPKSKEDIIKDLNKLSKKRRNAKLIDASRKGKLDIVKLLIENGTNINAKNENEYTSLMIAAIYGRNEIAKYLIKNNADINAKNQWGDTALMLASKKNRLAIAKMLIEAGADINVQSEYGNCTALRLAYLNNHIKIIKLLKKHKAKLFI